jgi:alkanesulfonate monooxygenase SsuD/methylene tetrahydromethanopterin reductase-like flavin-dependent oxidoreductase (luciferase family)
MGREFGIGLLIGASLYAACELILMALGTFAIGLIPAYERIGIHCYHTAEHHATPLGMSPSPSVFHSAVAQRTRTLLFGPLVYTLALYHPLRLAEDFALADIVTGGRMEFGVGRGTVPREILHLNDFAVSIGSHDNPDQASDDAKNREYFEEQMEIIHLALTQESFKFQGKYHQLPVPGIPDRGETVQELTLIPRPLYPFETWQAATSPPTVEYCPRVNHGAVFWNQNPQFIKRMWDRYGEVHEQHHGPGLPVSAQRMLVVSVRIEDTHEEAMRTARNGHDEFWKFLGPYGWSRGYMGEDGRPVGPGLIPSLEESMKQRTILVGTPEEVAAQVQDLKDLLGFEYLTLFPHLIGDPYSKAVEQMDRFMTEVVPMVR